MFKNLHLFVFSQSFLWICSTVRSSLLNPNLTDFSKCKVHYSRSGSVYKDFYELSESSYAPGMLLDFHFSVLAPSDAHILLAPSSTVEKDDPVYEIVIGAGGNTFCDIRRMQKSTVKASVRVKGLLSSLDIQSFWIHISNDGIIDVGKEGSDLGFLTWTDPDPLPLKVFSFSTWPGIEAKFLFDCPNSNRTTNTSRKIIRELPKLEQLRRDLLTNYDPYVRPVQNTSNLTMVEISLNTNTINLDDSSLVFSFSGLATLEWFDEKLQWNSSLYAGIETLHIFRREIWVPYLYCFNCLPGLKDILQDTMLLVNSAGRVKWTTGIHTRSWCDINEHFNWPQDLHMCIIYFSFFNDLTGLQIFFNTNKSTFSIAYSHQWNVLEIVTTTNMGWTNTSNFNNNINYYNNTNASSEEQWEIFLPPSLQIRFKIQRDSGILGHILYGPLYFAGFCLALIFWVSPFGHLKLALACLQLLISVIVLLVLDLITPMQYEDVPNIVVLYSYTIIACGICIGLSIVVINLSRIEQKTRLPRIFHKLFTSSVMNTILCIPHRKSPEEYGNLNESRTKLDITHYLWTLIGITIDRFSFLVLISAFIWISYHF